MSVIWVPTKAGKWDLSRDRHLYQTWVCEKTVVMDNINYIFQERFFHDSPSFPGENNYLIQKQENE